MFGINLRNSFEKAIFLKREVMIFNTIIKDLEITKKTLIFSVLGQTYYFLIAFSLFNPDLINQLDERFLIDLKFSYILLASFIMSFIWFFMNVCLASIELLFSYANNRFNTNSSAVFINAMISSIGYLTVVMLLNYIFEHDFKHFIIYAFTFAAIRFIWLLIKSLFSMKD